MDCARVIFDLCMKELLLKASWVAYHNIHFLFTHTTYTHTNAHTSY